MLIIIIVNRRALSPVRHAYLSSSQIGFWLKSDKITGRYLDYKDKYTSGGTYEVEKCWTISPYGYANIVDCRKSQEDFADVVCQYPLKN